jgi:hypothetical protein
MWLDQGAGEQVSSMRPDIVGYRGQVQLDGGRMHERNKVCIYRHARYLNLLVECGTTRMFLSKGGNLELNEFELTLVLRM